MTKLGEVITPGNPTKHAIADDRGNAWVLLPDTGQAMRIPDRLEKLASRFAVLSLASGQRGDGRGQSHRDYRELVINGIALTKRIGRDYLPVFGWRAARGSGRNAKLQRGRIRLP